MKPKALLIGNSDGIGLAATIRLLAAGWSIAGISRSDSPVKHSDYQHTVGNVSSAEYPEMVSYLAGEFAPDVCIYCVGNGELLNPEDMSSEPQIVDVNLTGVVKTAAGVIPGMVKRRRGQFIGISSVADERLSAEAPSYHASKAGMSRYLNSLSLALKSTGVKVITVRFGFVDTRMAKGEVRPFMMSVEKAVNHLEKCIRRKPMRYTAPRTVIPLIKFRRVMMWLGAA